MSTIAERLAGIRTKIAAAAKGADRQAGDVTLVAVSKTHPQSAVLDAIEQGQFVFGENRVQEAAEKFSTLKARYPQLQLHLIGPLQTNKTKDAVVLFDVIQTLDRIKLANHLATACAKLARTPNFYMQINTGAETQKAGVLIRDAEALFRHCTESCGLKISGLMCIPPVEEPSAPHFALLAKMAKEFAVKNLSMGMSADFETAIALGATHVRVGTAIFGVRDQAPES